jgi:hypothetical protein
MWILGVMFTLVMALSAVAWNGHADRITKNEHEISIRGPRIAIMEQYISQIEGRLQRIERKIDWLTCKESGRDCGPLP